ncbi:MAG: O-antigen polymerase [Desulfobulbus propionicus]|nr:MAG: O-antigen polymerase [Desulfobulbus propionicus]PIE60442.1 MAG: O-antigen polymerase [Desulfobulbus propionicus]
MNVNKICSSLLILLAFVIPVSTTATYIVLGMFLLFWILDNFKKTTKKLTLIITSNPVAMVGCIFFLIHLAGLFYTNANLEKILESIKDGGKFLFIAMAIIYLQEEKTKRAVLISFISAMGLILVLSYLIRFNMVPGFIPTKGSPLDCYVFHDHIKHNIFMAFTVFVTAVLARFANTIKTQVLWTGFSFLALINVLFMVTGRVGHLIILVLLVYYFCSWSSRKSVAIVSILFICIGLFLWCYPSNSLLNRARIAVSQIQAWNYGEPASKISSTGLRLEFYTNSVTLIKESPIIGTGTGSFQTAYSRLIKGTRFNQTDNPHNEYLMASVQFGLVGLLILLSFFITQWWYAGNLQEHENTLLARGFTLTIMTACMVTSSLQDSAEGWFFALMSATVFASQIRALD